MYVLMVEASFNMSVGSVYVINGWLYSQFRTAAPFLMVRIAE
jgi:hypothetical protein